LVRGTFAGSWSAIGSMAMHIGSLFSSVEHTKPFPQPVTTTASSSSLQHDENSAEPRFPDKQYPSVDSAPLCRRLRRRSVRPPLIIGIPSQQRFESGTESHRHNFPKRRRCGSNSGQSIARRCFSIQASSKWQKKDKIRIRD
jgi:hypothetical protein